MAGRRAGKALTPFDLADLPALAKGEQVSIVRFSGIDRKISRFEAEFYIANSLLDIECFTGEDIIELGQYNSIYGLNSDGKGFPVLRMNEFNGIFTGKPNQYSEKFSEEDFNLYSLKKGDILICRTNGNPKLVGKSALASKDYPYIYESHLFKIRPYNNLINPETLVVYLNTFHGKLEIEKFSMQGNQANFSLAKFKEMRIPKFSPELNIIIQDIINLSFSNLTNSENSYQQAQDLLLTELGLMDWQAGHQLSFVKNSADIFLAERMDADYYQPKYDEIIAAIKAYEGGWDRLGNVVLIKKSIEVGSDEYIDEGVPFVRVSNISPFEVTEEKYISEVLYSELTPYGDNLPFEDSKNHQPQQGEILFSKDGSPGIAYHLRDVPQKMIVSGGILRLKNKTDKVDNEYLTLVLNSLLMQEQVKRDVGGSVILHWRPEQVKATIIPLLPDPKQQDIQQKVTESFELRKQSKRLLEAAKRAVEMAIEENEDKAIAWLEAQNIGMQ